MAYIKNPDYQPGKIFPNNINAIEAKVNGGSQPLYGTGKYLDAYGKSCKLTNISFEKKIQGILGSDKAIQKDTNNIPGQ